MSEIDSAAALSVGREPIGGEATNEAHGEGAQIQGGQASSALPPGSAEDRVKYLVIDTETSGLSNFSLPAEHPDQPHLAEIVMSPCNEFFEPICQIEQFLIKPDGWTMSDGAIHVTGLTDAKLYAEGVPVRQALERYAYWLDRGVVVVAHNAQFDAKVMRGELRRAGMDDRFMITKTICTMRAMTDICQLMPKGNRRGYKWPTLTEAYQFVTKAARVGLAHTARNDVMDCTTLASYLLIHQRLPEPRVYLKRED
jgi:DNA polymerase-3 subunit epsilon